MNLVACERWLQQGDLFDRVPRPVANIDAVGAIKWTTEIGPAVLITYDCQLDKPKAERIHFAPARPLDSLDANSQALARKNGVQPYDAMYMGKSSRTEEWFCRPSETFWLPLAAVEGLVLEDFLDGQPPRRSIQGADPRLGTLGPEQRQLLSEKLSAFWGGQIAREALTLFD